MSEESTPSDKALEEISQNLQEIVDMGPVKEAGMRAEHQDFGAVRTELLERTQDRMDAYNEEVHRSEPSEEQEELVRETGMDDETYHPDGEDIEALEVLNEAIFKLKALKPENPSQKGRYYAIAITDMEKARAIVFTGLVHGVGLDQE